jgi:hypothetical protein
MNPATYWRSALGLFWAFTFCMLLALIVFMTHFSHLASFPVAILTSVILLVFLTAFLLFDKRIKAGFYMCLILSALFVLNQFLWLFFLIVLPSRLVSVEMLESLVFEESFSLMVVSGLLIAWGLFLFFATWKSRPVFQAEMKQEELSWLVQLRQKRLPPTKLAKPVSKENT